MTASSTPKAGSDVGPLVDRLRSSATAFRENTVYTSEGDPCRLGVQASEMDEAADVIGELLEALQWAVNHLEGRTRENAEQLSNCIDKCATAITKATANPIDTLPSGEGHE